MQTTKEIVWVALVGCFVGFALVGFAHTIMMETNQDYALTVRAVLKK